MSISRRDLYAAGEPLGDSATRAKVGGGVVCGFGGDSSSSTSTSIKNTDGRNAVQGGAAASGDRSVGASDGSKVLYGGTNNSVQDASGGVAFRGGNNSTLNITDGGIVSRALDSIDLSNATNSQGFAQLLNVATDMFSLSQKSVTDAYSQAAADKGGTLDNKTIIILAVVAGVALVIAKGKL